MPNEGAQRTANTKSAAKGAETEIIALVQVPGRFMALGREVPPGSHRLRRRW